MLDHDVRQEDESEILARKMKQEEEAVDICTMDDPLSISALEPNANQAAEHVGLNGVSTELDEDALWADEEPDEDVRGWKLKIIVGPEDGEENV